MKQQNSNNDSYSRPLKLGLDRSPMRPGKFAVVALRKIPTGGPLIHGNANEMMTFPRNAVQFDTDPEEEFFVIKLKDKYAEAALLAYSAAARNDDELEYASAVLELAIKAAAHPHRHKPD